MRAIETTGTVDGDRLLHLDEPLPVPGPGRVRVIVLFGDHDAGETSEAEWLRAAVANPAYAFLREPAEDVYSLADGRPFHDEG
ncbi:MAG: hypothetical protein HY744_19580 [Deltaproteobacteria bacterium]|nr:hypothetical protein [Deltaproteobacteria bacterium]